MENTKNLINLTVEQVENEKNQIFLQDELNRARTQVRWERFRKKLSNFFVACGGADPKIIRSIDNQTEVLSEEKKYRNTGYMLILPFIFGFLGMGMMVSVLAKSYVFGLIVGTIWGCIIVFAVDKPLLETLARTKGTGKKIAKSFLRMLSAVVLSLISLVFLEIAVFHDTIEGHIKTETAKKEQQMRLDARNRKDAINTKLQNSYTQLQNMVDQLALEAAGKGASGKAGRAGVYAEREKQVDLAKSKYSADSLLAVLDIQEIDSILAYDTKLLHNVEAHSILSQYRALERFLSEPDNKGVEVAVWILRFVIVLLELFAILHAISAAPSSYFYIVSAKNRARRVHLDTEHVNDVKSLRTAIINQIDDDFDAIKTTKHYNDIPQELQKEYIKYFAGQLKAWQERQLYTTFTDTDDNS
jgi:hypothetical protein